MNLEACIRDLEPHKLCYNHLLRKLQAGDHEALDPFLNTCAFLTAHLLFNSEKIRPRFEAHILQWCEFLEQMCLQSQGRLPELGKETYRSVPSLAPLPAAKVEEQTIKKDKLQ